MVPLGKVRRKVWETVEGLELIMEKLGIVPVISNREICITEKEFEAIWKWKIERKNRAEFQIITMEGVGKFKVMTLNDVCKYLGMGRQSVQNLAARRNLGKLHYIEGRVQRVFVEREIEIIKARKGAMLNYEQKEED